MHINPLTILKRLVLLGNASPRQGKSHYLAIEASAKGEVPRKLDYFGFVVPHETPKTDLHIKLGLVPRSVRVNVWINTLKTFFLRRKWLAISKSQKKCLLLSTREKTIFFLKEWTNWMKLFFKRLCSDDSMIIKKRIFKDIKIKITMKMIGYFIDNLQSFCRGHVISFHIHESLIALKNELVAKACNFATTISVKKMAYESASQNVCLTKSRK